jgi:hypothetical protein
MGPLMHVELKMHVEPTMHVEPKTMERWTT